MWRAAGFALAVATWACARGEARPTPARAEARRLYDASLAAELHLTYGDQERSLRAAARADPTYYPAVFDLAVGRPAPLVRVAAFVDSIAAAAADPGVGACIAEAAADYRGTHPARPRPAILTDEARACLDFAAAVNSSGRTVDELAALRRSLARFPAAPRLIASYIAWGHSARRFRDVAERARQFTSPRYPPAVRAGAWYVLASAEHGLDHDDRAAAAERAAFDDPAAGLPGYRAVLGEALAGHGSIPALAARADVAGLARHADSLRTFGEAITAAVAHEADPAARVALVAADAVRRLDRGQINEAIAELESIRGDAEALGDPGRTAYVLMRLGRALVKGGRAHDAERVLLEARAVGRAAGLPETQKEIEHNLLHLYESLGRADDAEAAGEEFMRLAGMGRLDPVRMMSVRDFGMFLRARGRVAESAPYFARMLADIDTLQYEWYYAGEYLELTGRLDDARRYYERAYDVEHEPIRTMEGLIRLSLATGDTASARHWAEMHDARRDAAGRPESRPLLPTVLRRSGTTDAARRAFTEARTTVRRAGQVAAWAALTTELASLEGDAGAFARARALADSAGTAARTVGAADVVLQAGAVAAYAAARAGVPAADRALGGVAATADATAGPQLRAEVHRLAGAVAAASGAWRPALQHYARAADALDSVAAAIALDPAQAAYRSAQRRVYDDALALVMAHRSEPGADSAYAAWSARRKARAFAVPIARAVSGRAAARLPVPGGVAVIDYVMLDTAIGALVRTARQSSLVRLDARATDVAADVRLLRLGLDARVGSSISLAHARLPLDVAHRLHRALLAPLAPLVGGAETLVVVPDGLLWLVPFDALVTSLPPAGADERLATFVLDHQRVIEAAAPTIDPGAWRLPDGPWHVVVSPTAPGAGAELAAIRRVHGPGLRVTDGTEFTDRRAARRGAPGAAVLHFIAHAEANDRDPGASRLDLGDPERPDAGSLTATDIATLSLDRPLVVLSACETAGGFVLDGEGVLSLSRSFLRAGARATVATLWPVGPGAASFAEAFYAAAIESRDAGRAAHAAKLALRRRGTPAYAWAAFQLIAGPAGPSRP